MRKVSKDLISKFREERDLKVSLILLSIKSNEFSELIIVKEHLSEIDLIQDS
jgi:hypothetical protein